MTWRARIVLPIAFLLCGPAFAMEKIWAEVQEPLEGDRIREPIGLVEVKGWAGTGFRGKHDVVVTLDRSASTFGPSGSDINGNGIVGRIRSLDRFGQRVRGMDDEGDTIASAQLVAAQRLIERLNPETTRMGLVTFGSTERIRAKIGSTREELLKALLLLPHAPETGGTYFYGAIIASINAFGIDPNNSSEQRHRSIIFLSDGLPNQPGTFADATKFAVRAAKHAARAGIRIHSFALGDVVASRPEVFQQMANATHGELLILEKPGEIVNLVPHLSLTKLSHVRIDNLSSSQPAKAVRLFPDGSFDAYAPLEVGKNILRITIHGEDGAEHAIDRVVHFTKLRSDDDKGRQRLEALRKQLEIRTLETQLAAEIRTRREEIRKRSLTIEVD